MIFSTVFSTQGPVNVSPLLPRLRTLSCIQPTSTYKGSGDEGRVGEKVPGDNGYCALLAALIAAAASISAGRWANTKRVVRYW